MSSLWTPGGEVPVGRDQGGRAPGGEQAAERPTPPGIEDLSPEDQERARAMAEQIAEAQRRLAQVPAAQVVANHAMGLFELGAIHLNQDPPNLGEARLAIDAMGVLLDGLRGRLGEDEAALRNALDQIRLAFVELSNRAGQAGGQPPGTSDTSTTSAE